MSACKHVQAAVYHRSEPDDATVKVFTSGVCHVLVGGIT